MKVLLLSLLLCVSAHASAQTAIVVKPDGTSQTYEPMRPRYIVKHDTLVQYVTVRDTLTHDSTTREVFYLDTGRVSLHLTVVTPSVQAPQAQSMTAFGVFGYADFHGAAVAPALSIDLSLIHFWLYAGARYQAVDHRTYLTAGVSAFSPLF